MTKIQIKKLSITVSIPKYETPGSSGMDIAAHIENAITTLSELTALTIVNSLHFFTLEPKEIILSGGGRKNKYILDRIKKISKISTNKIDDYKINGDFIESQAFAYLAIRSFLNKPISFPGTTGVSEPKTGGDIIKFK